MLIDGINIREALAEDWDEAMEVAWKTFLDFDAKDYSQEGIDNFRKLLDSGEMKDMFIAGVYKLHVATCGDRIVGIAGMRRTNHISLLFVDADYQHRGIARELVRSLQSSLPIPVGVKMTVNSAPYAVGFYHKLGFIDTDSELTSDGIVYTPMTLLRRVIG